MNIRCVKKLYFILLTVLCITAFTACGNNDRQTAAQNTRKDLSAKTMTSFALDTAISVTYYYENDARAVSDAMDLCRSYEQIFSRTAEDSELYKLNASINAADESHIIRTGSDGTDYYGFPVSEELYSILSECVKYSEVTIDGLRPFNYSLGAISSIYDFSGREHSVPTEEQLNSLLAHTDTSLFSMEDGMFITSDTDITLDLGAIAKGYISDKMKELMTGAGVKSAIIDLGGNVLLIGSKPDGSDFRVGIANPDSPGTALTTVPVSDCAVVSSGVYQRFFEADGKIYHHILNPETGLPVENGLAGVTVISDSACRADALSTLLFVLGAEKKEKLSELFPSEQFICIDKNLNIR